MSTASSLLEVESSASSAEVRLSGDGLFTVPFHLMPDFSALPFASSGGGVCAPGEIENSLDDLAGVAGSESPRVFVNVGFRDALFFFPSELLVLVIGLPGVSGLELEPISSRVRGFVFSETLEFFGADLVRARVSAALWSELGEVPCERAADIGGADEDTLFEVNCKSAVIKSTVFPTLNDGDDDFSNNPLLLGETDTGFMLKDCDRRLCT